MTMIEALRLMRDKTHMNFNSDFAYIYDRCVNHTCIDIVVLIIDSIDDKILLKIDRREYNKFTDEDVNKTLEKFDHFYPKMDKEAVIAALGPRIPDEYRYIKHIVVTEDTMESVFKAVIDDLNNYRQPEGYVEWPRSIYPLPEWFDASKVKYYRYK